ncbi:MAG: hypothetical protein JWP87_2227, partial [Labilithrix sp.]|nr:hypothetical protein [Labilithrix sp.]
MSMTITLVVAPNGVAIPEEEQAKVASPKLLWTLAPVAAALARPMLPNPTTPTELKTTLVHDEEIACVWQVGPWIIHGSDLRGGSLSAFQELVRLARGRSAGASALEAPAPLFVMSGCGADEGLPVGFIVQMATKEAPLPMVSFPLPRDVQTMWLVAKRLDLNARLGDEAVKAALADVAAVRASHGGEMAAAFEPMMRVLREKHGVV